MSLGYAVCKHLPLSEAAFTEQDSASARLCAICDTLHCGCPECVSAHRHEWPKSACALPFREVGIGPQEGAAIIGLLLAARSGRGAMTETDFSISKWNDDPARTVADVVAAFRKGAELADKEGL